MIVKKIFDGVFDDVVHANFLKFGRGIYENRYLIEGKRQAKKWAVKTSAEYANFLVKRCLEKIDGSVEIKGVIVSTSDLKNEINFDIKKVSNFQGVKKNIIDTSVEPLQILELIEKYPKVFFALSFKGEDFVLKIKAKAPSSAKPGKNGEKPVADFCSLKTENKSLVDELFFGVSNFKEVFINHIINVTDIIYPDNMNDLKPTEVRELSKRKGIIKRIAEVDGVEKISEANFVA